MNILFIGDVVGASGREKMSDVLLDLKRENSVDFTIVNGENSAGGIGIVKKTADELFSAGADVITLGNHTFDKKEVTEIIGDPRIVRPANYPDVVPGHGVYLKNGIAVVSLMGRFNMPLVNCPFASADMILEKIASCGASNKIIIVDFHAELTSEKKAMGYYLSGRVSAVVGTHTHVQTADERVFDSGTGYITDVGMVGGINSVIGMDKSKVLKRFLTGMPQRFDVDSDGISLNALLISIDGQTGKCKSVLRINK
ncbi:MAG: hypothetical protein BWY26_00576 [Elusimicrobia bacterium ADurb.Bin231]|nr:MAG: hypothetical protein BWY26_00576 [Elusimicrobia bacterium ADurb.Bin231]